MANVDKNQAVIDFLITCPQIQSNPLFFNFGNPKDNNAQLMAVANEKQLHKPFLDGSVEKQYTFTVMDFKSISYFAVVKDPQYLNENVEDMMDVQAIIDWVTEQNDIRNFPDFGEDCFIDSMEALTDNPNLNSIDTSVTPALARYSFSVRITYIDKSKTIWR